MSSTSQNQTKSNNNSSKSGKRTAVPQLSQPPRPTGVSAGTDVAAAIKLSLAWSTAAHKRLAARKESKGQEGRRMDVEQATAPEGEEGGKMDIKQPSASEALQGGGDVAMEVEQKSGGKKSPKKNSKKHGHQDEVEDTAGTETGGVSEAVSPPKEIPTRKHGPKASKGKGKVTTTEDGGISQEWEAPSVASVSNVPVEMAEKTTVYQHKASKIFPKLADCVMLSKDVVPNIKKTDIKKTELTEADMQSMLVRTTKQGSLEWKKAAQDMWALAMQSPYFAWGIIDEYANIWGSAWAEVIKKHRDGNLWCLWAVNDEISRGKWEDLVTQYFQKLASLATIAVQNITLMGTTSDNDKVHARVHAKLEWVHEGYMLQTGHPSSFKTLPIGNKLMFNNIQ
ncbi:hypothetical protein BKA82DRAFT_4365417 [Pisolithus tinctorius]|nr:hypothetical protein BKA82DRAFT_4365417 [Pisolithus tinctorius]